MEATTAEFDSLNEREKILEDSLATVESELLVCVVDEERKTYLRSREIALQDEITAIIIKRTAITNEKVLLLQQQRNLATLQPQRRVVHRSDFVRGVMDCNPPKNSDLCLSLVGVDVCVDETVAKVLTCVLSYFAYRLEHFNFMNCTEKAKKIWKMVSMQHCHSLIL
jgi:hypothetical protein